ncbi:MAG TPA: hypothetical protein VN648_12270, partial [Candidatus Methylomirabilis sp.]|nr:hypothetical protein [Candidatus Methylomirabilis sp.]
GTMVGFVYFQIAETLKDLAGTVIVVVVKDSSGRDVIFEIPLQGRRDLPTPNAPTAASAPAAPPKPVPLDPKDPKGTTVIQGSGGGVIIRSPAQ